MLACGIFGLTVALTSMMRVLSVRIKNDLLKPGEQQECFCRKGVCFENERGRDKVRALYQEIPDLCCKMLVEDTIGRDQIRKYKKHPEGDCIHHAEVQYQKWKSRVQGYPGWEERNWKQTSADDCRDAIGLAEETLLEFAKRQKWKDSPIKGMDNYWWTEEMLHGALMTGEDKSHGRLFKIEGERHFWPRALWSGEGAKWYAEKVLGAVILTSSAGSAMGSTLLLHSSNLHKKCHPSALERFWKFSSIGYVRQAKKDSPNSILNIVFNKTFDGWAQNSSLWLFEIPALAMDPPRAGVRIHNLSPHTCNEVVAELQARIVSTPRIDRLVWEDVALFSCWELSPSAGDQAGRSFLYRPPYQEHCRHSLQLASDSFRCISNETLPEEVHISSEVDAERLAMVVQSTRNTKLKINFNGPCASRRCGRLTFPIAKFLPPTISCLELGGEAGAYWEKLPQNLQALHVGVVEDPKAFKTLFSALPKKLQAFSASNVHTEILTKKQREELGTRLRAYDHEFSLSDFADFDAISLPQKLSYLDLNIQSFSSDTSKMMSMIQRLPPLLKQFNLTFHFIKDKSYVLFPLPIPTQAFGMPFCDTIRNSLPPQYAKVRADNSVRHDNHLTLQSLAGILGNLVLEDMVSQTCSFRFERLADG